jgi:hypothetical protein
MDAIKNKENIKHLKIKVKVTNDEIIYSNDNNNHELFGTLCMAEMLFILRQNEMYDMIKQNFKLNNVEFCAEKLEYNNIWKWSISVPRMDKL